MAVETGRLKSQRKYSIAEILQLRQQSCWNVFREDAGIILEPDTRILFRAVGQTPAELAAQTEQSVNKLGYKWPARDCVLAKQRPPAPHLHHPTHRASSGNTVNHQKKGVPPQDVEASAFLQAQQSPSKYTYEEEDWGDADEGDSEDENPQYKAFHVDGDPDFTIQEPDAEEYLRRVRWEARRCPRVVVAASVERLPAPREQTSYMPSLPGVASCAPQLLPVSEWETSFLADFSDLRTELVQLIELVDEGAAAVSSLASSAVGLPSWRDADGWKRFCFGPSPGALQKEGGSGKHNGAGEGLREEDAGEEATRLEGERPVLQKQELGSADSPRVKPNQVRTEEGGAESGLLETEQWGASRDCQEICGTAEAAENGKQEEQLERESLAERAEPFPRLDVVSVRPPEEEEHAQPLIERQPGQGGEGHGRDKPRRLPSPGAADAAGAAPRSRGASPVGTRNGEKEADLRQAGGRAASAPCDVPAEGGTAGETRGEEAGPPSREEALFQEHSVALSKLLIDHDGPAAVSNGLETTAFVSSGQAEAPQEARGGPGQGEEAVAGASGRADGPLPRRARRRAEKREPLLEAVLPFLGILLRMDPVTTALHLRYHIRWLQELAPAVPLTRLRAAWLFALCAAVSKPLDPDTLAALRALLRCCAHRRATKGSAADPELALLNILITIAGRYFGQQER